MRLGGVLGATWSRLGRLGRVLVASWTRLGDVLGASWKPLGGKDREKAPEAQLKPQNLTFTSIP